MSIVNKLIQVSRLFGVEQEEYIKSNFNSISDLDVLFLSFIMSQKLKRLDITYCSNTEMYLGKEQLNIKEQFVSAEVMEYTQNQQP